MLSFFFFNDTATTEIYTLSLHDALPISRIFGAGKLTGRLPGGLTIGVLDAVTQHVTGVGGVTIEPTSNYGVVRLRQDLRGGESSVGGIVTAVNRDNDAFTAPYLRRTAYVDATYFRHRFPGGGLEIWGSADVSRVAGTNKAIKIGRAHV